MSVENSAETYPIERVIGVRVLKIKGGEVAEIKEKED